MAPGFLQALVPAVVWEWCLLRFCPVRDVLEWSLPEACVARGACRCGRALVPAVGWEWVLLRFCPVRNVLELRLPEACVGRGPYRFRRMCVCVCVCPA